MMILLSLYIAWKISQWLEFQTLNCVNQFRMPCCHVEPCMNEHLAIEICRYVCLTSFRAIYAEFYPDKLVEMVFD